MNKEFHPGQRWVSNTESALGIGFIEKVEGRLLTIIFPAVEETRAYATDNAPLNRVKYPVGETINTEGNAGKIRITGHGEHNHCIVYEGLNDADESVKVHELELDSFSQFSQPQDRLFAGQVDKLEHFELRVATQRHMHRQQQSDSYGLAGPRIQPLAHQLYISHQVARRHAPRVLLADEVGLGKTIEAGLILHQQVLTERVKRALIIVPETLVHQWLVEMLRRFNLKFTILDEERCFAIEDEGDEETHINPFESAQLVLCSLDFLSENPVRHQQAVDAGWDMMIVDEAHHLSWSETHVSNEYACVESLSLEIPSLLLLTATPEQLGVEGHFARLRLLDPDRFYDLKEYVKEDQHYKPVNDLVQWLQDENANPNDAEKLKQLTDFLGKDAVAEYQKDYNTDSIIQNLLDRHGTGRVLYRNTRDSVGGFPQRELHSYGFDLPEIYETDTGELQHQLYPEADFDADHWIHDDPRVEWLEEWLEANPKEKVLLICAHAETALALEEYLRLRTSINASAFHEGLNIVERDRAAAYFAANAKDGEIGAQILLCSEIGSEGRNFQFAHHLVLFDLPLNPDLLEQRIGRLDRIGQTETIKIHVPYFNNTAQEKLMNWYHNGLNAFQHVCPVGHSIFEVFEKELRRELVAEEGDEFEELVARSKTFANETLSKMQQGRDRLLELNSCNKNHAEEVVDDVVSSTNTAELSGYMDAVFDEYGVDQQVHGVDSFILKPTDHMLNSDFPGLSEDGLTATYQRDIALSRDDMHFITWEHPMVTGAIDMIRTSEFGNATFCALPLKNKGYPKGTLILEAFYNVVCPAPSFLQIHRYLPESSVRITIDNHGRNLSTALKHDVLNHLAEKVKKRTTQDLIQHARPQIQVLIDKSSKQAAPQQDKIIEAAQQSFAEKAKDDLERLKALAKVNPNIRKEEITQLEENNQAVVEYLANAQLKLDAIRVALVTE